MSCCSSKVCCEKSYPSLNVKTVDEHKLLVKFWVKIGICLVLGGQAMMFGLGVNETPPEAFSVTYWVLHGLMIFSAVVAMILLGGPLFTETFKMVTQRKITVESLFFLSMIGALCGSLLSTIRGQGDIYYEVVPIVLSIYTIGKTIGLYSRRKAVEEVSKIRSSFNTVQKIKNIEEVADFVVVDIESLKVGDYVFVSPGKIIPVDGVIIKGKALVLETSINGETEPVPKHEDDSVYAGSFSVDGSLVIRNEKAYQDRLIDRILETVENAQQKPVRLQLIADRLMQWFLPLVLFFCGIAFFGWLYLGHWSQALFNTMAVLLVACPCALGLATPIAIWTTLWNLSKKGLVCRNGAFLDALASANYVIFDKTGTLSKETLVLESFSVTPVSKFQYNELLFILKLIEQGIDHPIARAIRNWVDDNVPRDSDNTEEQEGYGKKYQLKSVKIMPAQGLQAVVEEHTNGGLKLLNIHLGELSLMTYSARKMFDKMSTLTKPKKTLYLSIDDEPISTISFNEQLREGVKEDFTLLNELGVELIILTGDNDPQWENIEGVTIEKKLLPEQKKVRIEELRAKGAKVIFVGDGINDASAMTVADGSIAISSGSQLTQSTADAVLMNPKLSVIPYAIQLSKKMQHSIHDNMMIALFYNIIGMSLAVLGILHPVVAALIMLISSFTVSWRSFRIKLSTE